MRTRRITPVKKESPSVPEPTAEQESEDDGPKNMEEDREDQPDSEEALGEFPQERTGPGITSRGGNLGNGQNGHGTRATRGRSGTESN